MIKVFPIIMGSIAFLVTVKLLLKKGDNGYNSSISKFREDETIANFNTKNINEVSLNYVYPNIESINLGEYKNSNSINQKLDNVKKFSQLKMIKLPLNISNTELKKMVGVNNFEDASVLENHYNLYIRALYELGLALFKAEEFKECEMVLLEAIRLEGDISDIYILLYKIYEKDNNTEKILWLKSTVKSYDLSLKQSILKEFTKNDK